MAPRKLDPAIRPIGWAHGGSVHAAKKMIQLREQSEAGVRQMTRRRQYTQDQRAQLEVHRYQQSTNLLIPKASFQKLVKELTIKVSGREFRFQSTAMLALQEAAESYIVQLFIAAKDCRVHANRETLTVDDFRLAKRLRPSL